MLSALVSLAVASPSEGGMDDDAWHLTFLGAIGTESVLADLAFLRRVDIANTYFLALSAGRALASYRDYLTLEVEGQVVKHFERQHHFEFNGFLALRWHPFPWDRYLDTSFAVGSGLSYATEPPEIERDGETPRLLNFLVFEKAISLPGAPRWSLIGRIHHRSSVFGLFGERGGSNFLAVGIRYQF
ncbi:MAG: hypothetical protein ACE5JS_20330 [Nitrospinota bacterium]